MNLINRTLRTESYLVKFVVLNASDGIHSRDRSMEWNKSQGMDCKTWNKMHGLLGWAASYGIEFIDTRME
jgi:hypothetical protein